MMQGRFPTTWHEMIHLCSGIEQKRDKLNIPGGSP
jgi:hypothetical protein